MRFIRTLIINTMLVVACAILIQATGVPVANGITWGAAQVTAMVQQVALPSWVEEAPIKQIGKPVQEVVDQTVAWMASWGGDK